MALGAATMTATGACAQTPQAPQPPQATLNLPIASGPFQPDMASLKQYKCPDWFRDAKFGIWAHWGPQSVPMMGDWYARHMYEQGSPDYNDHLARWGHPSEHGYKDIIPLWKAEKWDPDRLMKLYKRAGARYFVSMGSHHDNFFLWNSKLHRWNAVNMGPHRDVVGEWQIAAKKNGLHFGVSEHLAASFTWFQASHGADKNGPKAGVPYDGADPQYQDLYHFPAEPGDTGWNSNNPRWQQQWYNEIRELVDNYHPDLLYSDSAVPFSNEVGRSMIAHFYNSNAALHGGTVEAVYNCKQKSEGRWVEDLERGIMSGIDPSPWQTDTSIGDWFYNKNWKFRPIQWVVDTLVDNVSKNGNLLLNVVQRPDGSLDPEVEQMLEQMAVWTQVHGEAIYGSRPWQVYGEGSVRARGGSFHEDYTYSAKDIRFTTKGATLYAIALGWPDDRRLTIRSLAKPAGASINRVSDIRLLGYKGKLTWTQTPDGLVVNLPEKPVSTLTTGLKIIGSDLQPVPVPVTEDVVRPDTAGKLVLSADLAMLHGDNLQTEQRGGQTNIGYWSHADEWVSWKVHVDAPGSYAITGEIAAIPNGAAFAIKTADRQVEIAMTPASDTPAPTEAAWGSFANVEVGTVTIPAAGDYTIALRPQDAATWKPINLRGLTLVPVH